MVTSWEFDTKILARRQQYTVSQTHSQAMPSQSKLNPVRHLSTYFFSKVSLNVLLNLAVRW